MCRQAGAWVGAARASRRPGEAVGGWPSLLPPEDEGPETSMCRRPQSAEGALGRSSALSSPGTCSTTSATCASVRVRVGVLGGARATARRRTGRQGGGRETERGGEGAEVRRASACAHAHAKTAVRTRRDCLAGLCTGSAQVLR